MEEPRLNETREAIWAMYHEGYRPEVIAERLGVALRTVYVYMSEKRRMEGIPPRPTGFSANDGRPRGRKKPPKAPPKKRKLVSYAGAGR